MDKASSTNVVGTGIFTFPEAARLTGINAQRIRRWFGADGRQAAFDASFHSPRGKEALSFLDLIDVLVAGKLREKGVSFQTLRNAYVNLQRKFGTLHAFCYRDVWTDGRTVFLEEMAEGGEKKLVDMERRQLVLTKVIEPFLHEIEYSTDELLAMRWNISEGVIVDPELNFGAPTLEHAGISSYVLAAAYKANGRNADRIASWYDISPEDVRLAVEFERSTAA